MQTPEQNAGFYGNQVNLACFEVGRRLYAFDIAHVREIVRYQEITPLPKAPTLIEGVIDLRGLVIPVIDLGRAMGADEVVAGTKARIVILELDGLVLGVCVEAAVDVLSLEAGDLADPPALATHAGYDAVRAVARRGDAEPIMVLAPEHILESVYRSAVPRGAS